MFQFPKPDRPVTHDQTLKLYRMGLISAGLVRHLAQSDDLLAVKLDMAGAPSAEALDKEG